MRITMTLDATDENHAELISALGEVHVNQRAQITLTGNGIVIHDTDRAEEEATKADDEVRGTLQQWRGDDHREGEVEFGQSYTGSKNHLLRPGRSFTAECGLRLDKETMQWSPAVPENTCMNCRHRKQEREKQERERG